MPQTVEIVGHGTVEFPDEMSDDQIADVLRRAPPFAAESPPVDSPNVAGAKAALEAMTRPFVRIPTVTGEDMQAAGLSPTTAAVVAGANQAAASLLEGVENPIGVATLGLGSAAKVGGAAARTLFRIATGGFAAQTVKGVSEAAGEVSVPETSLETTTRDVLGAMAGAGITRGLVKATLSKSAPLTAAALEKKGVNPNATRPIRGTEAEAGPNPETATGPSAEITTGAGGSPPASIERTSNATNQERIQESLQGERSPGIPRGEITEAGSSDSLQRAAQGEPPPGSVNAPLDVSGAQGATRDQVTEEVTPTETQGQKEIQKAGNVLTPPPETPGGTQSPGASPEQSPTAIKNETVDAERTARGLPPAMQAARQSFGDVWDSITKKIDADPGYPERLVNELRDSPRALTAEEDATLLQRQVSLQNEYAKATADLSKASDEGRGLDAAQAQTRVEQVSNQLLDLYDVGKRVGTETGRGLAARRMLVNEDFSLASLEMQKRAARGGKPITEEERGQLKELADEHAKAEGALDEHLAGADPRKALDEESLKLKFKLDQIENRWRENLNKEKLSNRTPVQKAIGALAESLNATRAIKTALDLSAVLRQGGIVVLGHPIRGLRAFPAMFRALRSEEGQFRVNEEIRARPNYQLYQRSKLYLAEHGQKLSTMEEAYMSRLAKKIPGVGASERAYTGFLNRLRADSFDAMAKGLTPDGKLTPEQAKAIANYVNVATGRGHLGVRDSTLVGMNTLFFAPRYAVSRFQFLAGQPFYSGTAATRALIAKEYARYLGGVATVYLLGKAAGADVQTDPRSSDFGKMRWGNTRLDPLSGLQQVTVLGSRLASGETVTQKGKLAAIRGPEVPAMGSTAWDVMTRFLRSKLSPVAGSAVNVATGSDYVGQPVTPQSEATNLLMPLSFGDIYQAMQDQGIPAGTALSVLALFGMGLQTYQPQPKRKYRR